jgi:hypothetical protein
MPRVYNKSIDVVPVDAVYVGRPSSWGNPYSHKEGTLAAHQVDTKEEAIWSFARDLAGNKALLDRVRKELQGKDLACWCRPRRGFKGRLLCHAQILMAAANGVPLESVE